MATPKSWSPYGNDQPPYGNSPSRSSSGPPGACRTPSRVRKVCRVSRMLILLCLVTGTVTCSDGQGCPESSDAGSVRLAGHADDPRRDRGEGRGWREAEPAAPLEGERAADSRLRTALDVAAAHQARPDEVGGPLVAGEDSVTAAHVLVEAQLAAGPQDAAEFGQRRRDIGYRAQQPGDDDRVELPVGGGQVPGGAVGQPNRDGRGRLGRAVMQVRLRL